MVSLSFSATLTGGEVSSFMSGSPIGFQKDIGRDGISKHLCGTNSIWLKNLERIRHRNRCRPCVVARVKKGQKHEYPWPEDIDPNAKGGYLRYLSYFKPLAQKPKPVTLEFEKPLVDLEKKINDVCKMADDTGLDLSDQINLLESKYQEALKDLYTHLTPIQRLQIARHPNRPTFLDHVFNITDKFVELHGDRAGYDDPAIVCGIGSIDGQSYMFIGHQKGRNTKENIQRNFGMPTPHGYRKALRLMRYADHHGFPIITLIDTPGAFADLKSEELGQGEAIAFNLREMFSLKVPIVSVVIGEGGSGGALAIGCANKLLMLENAVFYVASPEACAAILWKSSQAAPKAAEKLRITASELCKFKVADGIIPEPLGGAHRDPSWTSQQIKIAVTEAMEELRAMDPDTLLAHRQVRHRHIGGFVEGKFVEPERKRNMKQKEVDISAIEVHLENLKKKAQEAGSVFPRISISEEAIDKLREEVDKDVVNAFISMGLEEKLEGIKLELSKSSNPSEQAISPGLKEEADKLVQEFNQKLSRPGSYLSLKQKLQMLNEVTRLMESREKGEKLKKEMNKNLPGKLKEKVAILNKARQKVALGDQLDDDLIEEVQVAKEEMAEALKSLNLNLVGMGKKMLPTAPPNLREKMTEVDEMTEKEIKKAVDVGGLRGKIAELKEEISRHASKERIEELEKEIRDGIVAVMDVPELKKKIESLAMETPPTASVGADDGRV